MRVAFISRPTLFTVKGGDTVQMIQTAAALKKRGVHVDIYPADQSIPYEHYDLLHFFNIIRPASILRHIKNHEVPFVLSPIYVKYDHYDKSKASLLRRLLAHVLGFNGMEYVKALARRIKNGENIGSWYYLLRGHKASIKKILSKCRWLLPNSESEYTRLCRDYPNEVPYSVVTNGIHAETFDQKTESKKIPGSVLCAARIEGHKNQLELIRALKGSGYRLRLAGAPAPNHLSYLEACQKEADEQVEFLGVLEGDALLSAYQEAEVHALPSFFETTGLSSLEAAVCGCKLVMSRQGDEYDYFGEDAFYCDPNDARSIRAAIDKAMQAPYSDTLKNRILQEHQWEHCAEQTLAVYQNVLK
ncbi:MAG: glycosyltransferase family 4 protein [Bacteroidota bacterium]|nr:glycosyltransferase family 4 protein [Bacteroidota bacterium]MDX5431723.1 glycosyltransferase family 4 protein [Bacteroidota bacterium]MDX5470438.1 glycosyltransferase family 4 protein [Bacteroidota bacterium]